jgi:hypothetical protein
MVYHKANYQKHKQQWHEYYLKNRDYILKKRKEYRQKNPNKIKEYELKNRDYTLKRKREYYQKNKEIIKAKWKEYRFKNRDIVLKRIREHHKIAREKRRKLLNDILGSKCSICDSTFKICYHEIHGKPHNNRNYIFKHLKDFIPLCKKCHVNIHYLIRVSKNKSKLKEILESLAQNSFIA